MTTGNLVKPHYPALDGLRGVAILLVVVFHNFGFIQQSVFGWLGVDLFFVLSGFLITSGLMQSLGSAGFLKKFYIRRVLRIFPLYYLVLIVCLIILPIMGMYHDHLHYYIVHQGWLWLYLQNWLYTFYPPDSTFLVHLWSLAVEEQYYLIWPFIILWIRSPKRLLYFLLFVLCVLMIARSVLWFYNVANLQYASFYTFTRIDGICIGSILALLYRIDKSLPDKYTFPVVIALAALNFIFYFLNLRYGFSFPYLAMIGYTTFAVMFGFVVHEAVKGSNRIVQFIFNWSVLRFFGRVSYGFYLFHWPVYLIASPLLLPFVRDVFPEPYWPVAVSILATSIGLLISVISFYTFERYFIRLKKHF